MANKITFANKVGLIAKLTHINQWWDDDANEVKTKHNLNDDRITAVEGNTVDVQINAATEKTTPVDADKFGITDSAASGVLKWVSWTNIKATFKAYFDTIYAAIADLTAIEIRVDNLESITSSLILYLDTSASDISTYEQLLRTPTTTTLATEVITINANTVIFDSYATELGFPGATTIPAGIWSTHGHFQFSSVTGTNNIHWDVYKRTSGGTETLLFRISSPAITSTAEQELLIQTAEAEVVLAMGDRLVVKLYAQTTGASKTCTFRYSSPTKFAFIQPPAFSIALNHDSMLLVNDAGVGVAKGHISDQAQSILGLKTFSNLLTLFFGTAASENVMHKIVANATDTNTAAVLRMLCSTNVNGAVGVEIVAKRTNAGATGDHDLILRNSTGATLSDKLTIKASGKILIATAPTAESTTANPILTRDTLTGEIKTGGKQVVSIASDTTPNPTGWAYENEYYLTALAGAAEFAAPSGTPVNGNTLLIRIKDDGTARAITWNVIYRGLFETIPTTTVLSKTAYWGFIYNSTDSKWDYVSKVNEA